MEPSDDEKVYLHHSRHSFECYSDIISISWLPYLHINNLIPEPEIHKIANDRRIATHHRTHDEIITSIISTIPIKWMTEILEWIDNHPKKSEHLDFYCSDSGFNLLTKYNQSKNLTTAEYQQLQKINSTIIDCWRLLGGPEIGFYVFRGTKSNITYNEGEIITFPTPKSASFLLSYVERYVDSQEGAIYNLLRIYVPHHSVVGYYHSEDQVIFPMTSRLLIISQPYQQTTSLGITTLQDAIYLVM